MEFIFVILLKLIDLYTYIVIGAVILSWLLAFQILPLTNKIVYRIVMGIRNLTEPVFDAVRRVIPTIFGLDISPIIILFALQGIKIALIKLYFAI